jgi:hypothetical protein
MAEELSGMCYQCGINEPAIGHEEGWFTCGNCDARLYTVKEWRQQLDQNVIDRAKRNLGVEEFMAGKPRR